ncbi:aspartyl protease family protein 1-like isoform X2 [Rhodamnia argentea]|uniref:Aspartyl protease family protein 1-like isoform X2 n=1 Tax=Rhodamnia argentea TaxID=178133 RepID=A0A8B8PLX0_9MYRT|nr:aspartyl protease family protein 1-like isoform X2 [Rhodamnia argentea]
MATPPPAPDRAAFLTALVSLALVLASESRVCCGFATFGFDVHHLFSDPVKGVLAVDRLPEKGSLEYYKVMAMRDRAIHGRRLAAASSSSSGNQTVLTFSSGNETILSPYLGYLHYANVSVGTPSLSYLVALDTGSDLFWLPCDCKSCVNGLKTSSGQTIDFNIYSPNASSTSAEVPCNSTMCGQRSQCSSALSSCDYQVVYLSNGTSSTGILVEDVLHLTTDDNQSKAVNAKITFGCGQIQTGSFLDGAAPNGLFGLGMTNMSVPSILAEEGLTSNSFSMCFGPDGIGRISFGDKGSSDQGETPFNLRQSHPTYNITLTQINVGGTAQDVEFSAIFDSGTSFTYLNDPAYTFIGETFNSLAQEKRHSSDSSIPFEYCYDLSPNQSSFETATLNMTLKGGDQFYVTNPIEVISDQASSIYCLALVKSGDVNIIGQNFMTGYRIVFDRERMVLGWKSSNCYSATDSSTLPISPTNSSPPAIAVNPQDTSGSGNNSVAGNSSSSMSIHSHLIPFICTFVMILFPILAIV